MSGKFPRSLWISYMFTFLLLSQKWGAIGSFVTNTWERKLRIISVRNPGVLRWKDTWAPLGNRSWYFAKSEGRAGYTRPETHQTLALCPIFLGTFPREYIHERVASGLWKCSSTPCKVELTQHTWWRSSQSDRSVSPQAPQKQGFRFKLWVSIPGLWRAPDFMVRPCS